MFGNRSSGTSVATAMQEEAEKCPADPVESFCKCELEQMNIAFVLPGRRDGAPAVWRRGGENIIDRL